MDLGNLAEFLGAWLKELIHTIIEALDFLDVNFGIKVLPEDDEAADAE